MIVGIQAALLCEHAEMDDLGRISYLRVHGASLFSDVRPGYDIVVIALHLVSDGKAGDIIIRVTAPDYDEAFQVPVMAGLDLTSAVMQLGVPITRQGELKVDVINAGGQTRPLRVRWGLQFTPDVEDQPEKLAAIVAEARRLANIQRSALSGRLGPLQ